MPEIRSCVHDPESTLRLDLSLAEIADALKKPDALVWVDIGADGREDGEPILRDLFGFHQLTIDDCYNATIDPPKVDDYGDYLFIIIHNVLYDDAGLGLLTNELNLYVGQNYVVSIHRSPVRAVEDVRMRAQKHALVLQHGPAFLAHALIDVVVDDFHPIVERIDEQVSAVEEEVLEHPQKETLERVLRLKRTGQRLKRSILPQRDVMNRLSRNEYPRLIPASAMMYFRDIYDHTVRVDEMIEGVRDLADSALNTYLSSVNNRINEVTKVLTIVAVVFLPLTLLASIYGTNFTTTFPDYEWGPGFAGMIVTMLLIAACLFALFRWRRWF